MFHGAIQKITEAHFYCPRCTCQLRNVSRQSAVSSTITDNAPKHPFVWHRHLGTNEMGSSTVLASSYQQRIIDY